LNIGTYEFTFIGNALYEEFNQYGYKPNRKKLKFCIAKLGAVFIPEVKSVLTSWGMNVSVSNKKIKEHMNFEFRDMKQTISEMGYSLIEKGYVPDKRKK
jgi:hypothetical protein